MPPAPLEFPGQPDLPNDRVQREWCELLAHIMTSRSKADVRATYNQAQGYMAALHDVDLIDADDLKRMGTTALHALNEALERFHHDAEGN